MPLHERHDGLVSAAIRVISRDGVAAATTRRVVAEAGMPLGAFHYVFDSQEHLMRAVVELVTEQERFAAQVGSIDASSMRTALRDGLYAYIDLLVADADRELALFELALYARRHLGADTMRDQWTTYFDTGETLLNYAAVLTGSRWTAPLPDLARMLVAFADGITVAWLADHDTDAARRTADLAAAALAAHARPVRTTENADAD